MTTKRNVNAENHLLTGGLVTGFLTFMGFLPAAAVGAAVTGAAIAKDFSKAKKEEAFKHDFEAHQRMMVEVDKRWREIESLFYYLKFFSPTNKEYLEQEELEKLFENARRVEKYDTSAKKSERVYEKGKMIKLAKGAKDENKIIEYERGQVFSYIIEDGKKCVVFSGFLKYPYQFKEKCLKAGIPFKEYGYSDVEEVRNELYVKFYTPYNFNFKKYN